MCVPVSWLAFHMWEFASGAAASRESGAENQSGSWHGQAPTIPAGSSQYQKGGKSLKQMKVSLLLSLILRFNSTSKHLIRIFFEFFFILWKVLTF